jgi:hypothetical protein
MLTSVRLNAIAGLNIQRRTKAAPAGSGRRSRGHSQGGRLFGASYAKRNALPLVVRWQEVA